MHASNPAFWGSTLLLCLISTYAIIKWREINDIIGISMFFEDLNSKKESVKLVVPLANEKCDKERLQNEGENYRVFNLDEIGLFPVSVWMHNIDVGEIDLNLNLYDTSDATDFNDW